MQYVPTPYIDKVLSPNRDLFQKKAINLVYCGDYNSEIRNILPLYYAVLASEKFNLTICGQSDLKLINNTNVSIMPRCSLETVRNLEKEADILVCLSNLKGSQIPGKIYQYSGTNKPILFLLDGDKKGLLYIFGGYERFNFSNNNMEEILLELDNIINNENYNRYSVIEEFSKVSVCKKILE